MTQLEAHDLTLSYHHATVIDHLDVSIPDHQITMIIGANGCGKSTLLRSLARLLKPRTGTVQLNGYDIRTMGSVALARQLGLLPQSPLAPDGITVAELVRRGRYPHQGLFKRFSKYDAEAVAEAMSMTAVTELADRNVDELSGGQRQRVWIALALAQQTELLLLDEPTTYLDITHQLEILDVICDLNARRKTTIVIVLHDLNLAARYADHLIAVKDGKIFSAGAPAELITQENLREVFDMSCQVITDPVSNTPLILPIGRHKSGSQKDPKNQ